MPPSPQAASPTPTQLVIPLATTITIPTRYYTQSGFQPDYQLLQDGSLLTGTYRQELLQSYYALLLFSMITVLFFRNIVVSAGYLRRGRIKRKFLFYMLFASQLLGPVALIPILVGFFHPSVNCDFIILFSSSARILSIFILVNGILGVKAYFCLDRSRIVGGFLVAFQIVWFVFAVLSTKDMTSEHNLSGECLRISGGKIVVLVAIQSGLAFFISCCFFYAVWKSSGAPAVRGRISLQLWMDDAESVPESQGRNGSWWDYVPGSDKPRTNSAALPATPSLKSRLRQFWRTTDESDEKASIVAARKSSIPGEFPIPQPPRPPVVRISAPSSSSSLTIGRKSKRRTSRSPEPMAPRTAFSGRNDAEHASGSRMLLFRAVMRDELVYTTAVTVITVVVSVIAVVGIHTDTVVDISGWFMLNWSVISWLAVHSFGRVVHRHEIEHMVQRPWKWDPSYRRGSRNIDMDLPLPLANLDPPRGRDVESTGHWTPPTRSTYRHTRPRGRLYSPPRSPHSMDEEDLGTSFSAGMRLYPDQVDASTMTQDSSMFEPSPDPSEMQHTPVMEIPLHGAAFRSAEPPSPTDSSHADPISLLYPAPSRRETSESDEMVFSLPDDAASLTPRTEEGGDEIKFTMPFPVHDD